MPIRPTSLVRFFPRFFARLSFRSVRSPARASALACALGLALSLHAPAPSAAPPAGSSFIGMGTTTGTPSSDIRAAIRPDMAEIPEPEAIKNAKISADALVGVPVISERMRIGRPIRIGIEAELGRTQYASWIRYTLEALRHALGKKNVQVFYLDGRGLSVALQNSEIDFFIANSHTFALQQSKTTVEQLATFLPVDALRAEEAQAGVLFMKKGALEGNMLARNDAGGSTSATTVATQRAVTSDGTATVFTSTGSRVSERQNLQHLIESLKEGGIVAVERTSLGGWLAPLALLQREGLSAQAAGRRTTFTNGDERAVLDAVLSGEAVLGILPACSLERFQEAGVVDAKRDLVIVDPQLADGLACTHSTPTYPGWAFGTTAKTDPLLKKNIGSLLFSMNADRYGGQWQFPALNRSIYDLFYELKMGPYEHLATWSLHRFMRENSEALALIIFLTFVVISYAVSLSVLVRRKTQQLRDALHDRDLVEAEAAQSRQHIANLERTGIVGQMSTIIAHELKQPLSAISNYANSLHRRTKNDKFDKESFIWALTEIANEAERASRIVDRVRSYAKHDYPPRTVTDLSVVIGNSITTFRRSRQTNAEIVVRVNPGSMAEVDAWEIELAVLNLLKNAADAISGVEKPRIEVSLVARDSKTWALSVGDNGPYISDEQLALFFKPLQTTKGAKGMGLGLSIVANIAERHAGRVTVERNGTAGVRFTITFPRLPGETEKPIEDAMLPPRMTVYEGNPKPAKSAGMLDAQIRSEVDRAAERDHPSERSDRTPGEDTPVTIHSRGFSRMLDRLEGKS